MSTFCPSCGSTNEATYKFCRSCGTPLAPLAGAEAVAPAPPEPTTEPAAQQEPAAPPPAEPAAPPPPMPPAAPPPVAPAAPPAPPAAPAAGQPPGPRVSPPVMIGLLVAVLGVSAAAGIVLGRGPVDPAPSTTPGRASASQAPGPSPRQSLAPNESPSPTASPRPSQPPPATPEPSEAGPTPSAGTGDNGATKVVKAEYVSVTVPVAWEVEAEQFTLAVYPTVGGSLFLESGALNDPAAPKTTADLIRSEIERRRNRFPDLTVCGAETDFQVFNGPAGRAVTLCYTAATATGAAYPAKVHIFGAIVVNGTDTLLFHQKVYAGADVWEDTIAAVNPVLESTQWALFTGN